MAYLQRLGYFLFTVNFLGVLIKFLTPVMLYFGTARAYRNDEYDSRDRKEDDRAICVELSLLYACPSSSSANRINLHEGIVFFHYFDGSQ